MNEEFNRDKSQKEAELKEAKLLEEKQAKEVSDRIERNAIRLNACENVEMLGSVYNAFSQLKNRNERFNY
jgi:hypothetical protein